MKKNVNNKNSATLQDSSWQALKKPYSSLVPPKTPTLAKKRDIANPKIRKQATFESPVGGLNQNRQTPKVTTRQ
jgi:hypothetical protein